MIPLTPKKYLFINLLKTKGKTFQRTDNCWDPIPICWYSLYCILMFK